MENIMVVWIFFLFRFMGIKFTKSYLKEYIINHFNAESLNVK